MCKNHYVKNILSALSVAFFSFVLLNLTFMFDFFIHSLIGLFFPATNRWFPQMKNIIFIITIILISLLVFKSKLREFFKVIYLTVTLTVILITIGIFLYRWPILTYSVSGLILGSIVFYLYRNKKSWLYYYSVILVASVLLIMNLFRIDI